MKKKEYSSLTKEQISQLEKNLCRSDDWTQVIVSEDFKTSNIHNVEFKGTIKIGGISGTFKSSDGELYNCCVSNAMLENVELSNNCYIKNISGKIKNCFIGSNVVIENCNVIQCNEKSSFGNGVAVAVLNEAGGRSLPIVKNMSAATAYIYTIFRDDKTFINKLDSIFNKYVKETLSFKMIIGEKSLIKNVSEIININFYPGSIINGALSLKNGTVDSSIDNPTYIGMGVIAKDFIIQKGANVDEGSMLDRTLIGEGTKIGKQFSSVDSIFMANSEGYHSEIVSLFGGPYTVTHHRSTLLIAIMTSFYNAGSSTNQSNHMYKLGPIHQGVLERGCKTGSCCYMKLPIHCAPFTVVIGSHFKSFDSSDFPFSYIMEGQNGSTINPGTLYFTVGSYRDSQKWPVRDNRKGKVKIDPINFNLINPYIAEKIIKAISILEDILKKIINNDDEIRLKGIIFSKSKLKSGIRFYRLILDKYFGEILKNKLSIDENISIDFLKANMENNMEKWYDLSGLVIPFHKIDILKRQLFSENINSIDQLNNFLNEVAADYQNDEWSWFLTRYKIFLPSFDDGNIKQTLTQLIENWFHAEKSYYRYLLKDAAKDYGDEAHISYGLSGDIKGDFDTVRGIKEDNNIILDLNDKMTVIEKEYHNFLKKISFKK